MDLLERFLRYVSISTTSSSKSTTSPSTETQKDLAKVLIQELQDLGVDVTFDSQHCYVYGILKGNVDAPKVGFISHLDTSEDAPGENIKPQIIKNYDGKDIKLNAEVTSEVAVYPDLKNHVGKTLITTDGTTLLGADDKAGIAEIMQMVEYFSLSNDPHGDICICFTPDEEIGDGIKYFDFTNFPADFAYTVDGSSLGEISYENFNAATITITIEGVSAHLGYAKGILVNAAQIATIINSMVPDETPANTENREGYFHLNNIEGDIKSAKMIYLIRDFDKLGFARRKQIMQEIVARLNARFNNCISIDIKDSYYNMYDKISKNMDLINKAREAMQSLGVTPITIITRGGTDGAALAFKGLPCPNLGTGAHSFHSIFEYTTLEDMSKSTEILINIVKLYAKEKASTLNRSKQNG